MAFSAVSQFVYGDDLGFNNWLLAHYLEHVEFIDTLQDNSFTVLAYPIQSMEDPDQWLQTHHRMHQAIWTAIGGGTSTNLAAVDWKKDDQVQDWLEIHARIHQQIRDSLGI